jgi:hypothetical protein
LPHSVQLAKLFFELNVRPKHLLFGAEADRPSVGLPRLCEIIAPETEISEMNPQFAEGELLVRDYLQRPLEYGFSLHWIALLLLPNCVVEPQVDVAPPKAFLFSGGQLGNCGLVDFPDPFRIS